MATEYPASIAPVDHVEPVPRRIRAVRDGVTLLDTVRARYVWEWPNYPQYYVPAADVAGGAPAPTDKTHAALPGYVRFAWDAFDAWYEEDEQVFVHPRNPFSRVDALRSTRSVRVELDGVVLADSSSPVMVFETGLPPRYYLNRTDVDFTHLVASATETACPYKGRTSEYWSIRTPTGLHADLAWAYAFPTAALLPIAGLVCFYNEKVDITLDGERLERPRTPFS
jgi:uncharacterized protein (DUF427 family)